VTRERLVIGGIAWNLAFQLFQALVSFGAMVILVRVIPPVEYGKVGAAVGILALLNAFTCGAFISQALQLPEGEEPDWSQHFAAGFHFQAALFVLCNGAAVICRHVAGYESLAPLLHLGSIGLLLDGPAQLAQVRLRRALAFRRWRIVLAISTALSTAVTLAWGLNGGGAEAIVVGGNVLTALPFAVDLLVVEGWRPRKRWWHVDWRSYRPALHFGLQQGLSSLVQTASVAAAAAVLPAALGLYAMGLLSRARALVYSTVGRFLPVILDAVYPILPRLAAERDTWPRQALRFVRALSWALWPAAIFTGLAGPLLSRVVYGDKWIAVDPLLWPAAAACVGSMAVATAKSVLLAANHLRLCFILDVVEALLTVPMVAVAWAGGGMVPYAWAVAGAQVATGAICLASASFLLPARGLWSVLAPVAVATGGAAALGLGADHLVLSLRPLPRVLVDATVYSLVWIAVMRALFPRALGEALAVLPRGARLAAWLGLNPALI
jgi:O-antigen/teichoic acid export membrane protein